MRVGRAKLSRQRATDSRRIINATASSQIFYSA